MKKYNIPLRAIPDVSARQIWARDILQTNDCMAKTAYLNQLKFSYKYTKRVHSWRKQVYTFTLDL